METLEKRRNSGSSKQQVLVEFKVNRKAAEKGTPLLLATKLMDSLKIKFDKSYNPKSVKPTDKHKVDMVKSREDNIHFLLRASVDKTEAKALKEHEEIIAVWNDFQVFPAKCPGDREPRGTSENVRDSLDTEILRAHWERGLTYTFVGVVDGGINITPGPNVINPIPPRSVLQNFGFRPESSSHNSPGTFSVWDDHGSMMARDILLVASGCEIVDIRIANDDGRAPISNVIDAYDWAIEFNRGLNLPFILANGWTVYDPNLEPTNLDHPIHRKVNEALENGLIILCPAGNCGTNCPNNQCGTGYDRAGSSIWGISGNEGVITVGATDFNGNYLEYSSEGPAISYATGSYVPGSDPATTLSFSFPIETNKPDFCSISHFAGYTNCDNGTSAATATAAGVAVLLLRGKYPVPTHREIKQALIRSARNMGRWDPRTGYGLINAQRAYEYLSHGF